jgi:hypothetical protein
MHHLSSTINQEKSKKDICIRERDPNFLKRAQILAKYPSPNGRAMIQMK